MSEKKETRVDTDITLVWLKKFSDPVVRWLVKTPLTPNQVTLGNFLIFAPLVGYLLVIGGYRNNILALIALGASSLLDLMDGEMVRQGKPSSKLGIWYELSLDPLIQGVVIFSIALHVLTSDAATWKYWVLLPLFGQGFANYFGLMLTNKFKIDPFTGHQPLLEAVAGSTSTVDVVLSNMLVPTHWLFVTLFTLRFQMIVGIVFNILPYTFLLFGVLITIRTLAIYIILCLHYSQKNARLDSYRVFRYLNEVTHQ